MHLDVIIISPSSSQAMQPSSAGPCACTSDLFNGNSLMDIQLEGTNGLYGMTSICSYPVLCSAEVSVLRTRDESVILFQVMGMVSV